MNTALPHTPRYLPSCRTILTSPLLSLHIQILVSLLLICLSPLTYKSIQRIDRRPTLVAGEFVGVGAFMLHAIALMPLLS